jgi:hypothetical protein
MEQTIDESRRGMGYCFRASILVLSHTRPMKDGRDGFGLCPPLLLYPRFADRVCFPDEQR